MSIRKTGKLQFYSEAGTEGGYYALQDGDFINYTSPPVGSLCSPYRLRPRDDFRSGIVEAAQREGGSIFDPSKLNKFHTLLLNGKMEGATY